MGTRSLTHIHDGDLADEILLTIYRQFDGYPDAMGKDLAEIIAPLEIVNGFQGGAQANGMGCLAAQIVAGLKDGVGNVYIYKAGAKDCCEEYTYHVFAQKPEGADYPSGLPWIKVSETDSGGIEGKLLFEGPANTFAEWLEDFKKQQQEA